MNAMFTPQELDEQQRLQDLFDTWHREYYLQPGVWITRNGREVPIAELHDLHIKNILHIAFRGEFPEWLAPKVEAVAHEALRRNLYQSEEPPM